MDVLVLKMSPTSVGLKRTCSASAGATGLVVAGVKPRSSSQPIWALDAVAPQAVEPCQQTVTVTSLDSWPPDVVVLCWNRLPEAPGVIAGMLPVAMEANCTDDTLFQAVMSASQMP